MSNKLACFAHRGASGHEPENTELRFEKSIELGASWIELDIRAVEGQSVVFHDRDLKRMTGTKGLVSKQSIKALKALPLPKNQSIPLLSEVLGKFKGRVSLQVELKGANIATAAAAELKAALANGWDQNSLLVSSFDQAELMTFKRLVPEIPIGVLVYGYPLNCLGIARRLGASSVHFNLDAVSKERVLKVKRAGFKVYVYTVDDPEDIKLLISWGVDGVFSNFPERVLAA
jgi:glycerophosphoryl diester phosphodiesterase